MKVWRDLSANTKSLFENYKIKYQRTVAEHIWKRYLAAELKGNIQPPEITVDHLMKVQNMVKGLSIKLNDDMSASFSYITSAVNSIAFSDEPAFANSLLGPSYNYEKPVITLENNDPISEEILNELKNVTELHTKEIRWESGDVAVIDNMRFMHGRRQILDPVRKIHAAMSYLF